ncbi:hypothetical protein PG997_002910 [Apiospora hydei]|uniref:Uncharacterized protein n=1 Tax=Apiospora hydei TaxID=1337664 RepID=A0ABR1WXU6_9PEZI
MATRSKRQDWKDLRSPEDLKMYVGVHDYIAQLIRHGLVKEARYPNAASRRASEEKQAQYDPVRNTAFAAVASNYRRHARKQLEDLGCDLDQLESPLHLTQAHPLRQMTTRLLLVYFLMLLSSILLHALNVKGIL